MINSEEATNKLVDFLDNNTYITPEEAKQALEKLTPIKGNYNKLPSNIMLRIVKLISKRTEEVSNFLDVLNDNTISEEEKKIIYQKNFPFKGSNYEVEKTIIETIYGAENYETLEDLIIDLVYDDVEEPEILKEQIRNVMLDNNIEIGKTKKHVR